MDSNRHSKIFHYGVWGVFLCACVGLLCRLTVRDSVPYLSVFFYAFKPAVLALSFFLAAWYFKRKLRVIMVGSLIASACCFYWWLDNGFVFHPSNNGVTEASDVKAMLWNTFHGRGGWQRIADEINSAEADLIVLTEADKAPNNRVNFWNDNFPSYHFKYLENSMALLSRGPVKNVSCGNLAGKSSFARVETQINKKSFVVYAVDFYSSPFNSRKSAFDQLYKLLGKDYYLPVLMLGDFNTPEESYFFDELRKRKFKHVLSSSGNGMKATWPMPVPFLDLDHAWASPKIKVLGSQLEWSALSDHRPLLFFFNFYQDESPSIWARKVQSVSRNPIF